MVTERGLQFARTLTARRMRAPTRPGSARDAKARRNSRCVLDVHRLTVAAGPWKWHLWGHLHSLASSNCNSGVARSRKSGTNGEIGNSRSHGDSQGLETILG